MPFDTWYHAHTLDVAEILHEPDLYALTRLLAMAYAAGADAGKARHCRAS